MGPEMVSVPLTPELNPMSTKSEINRYASMNLAAAEKEVVDLAQTKSVAGVHETLARIMFGQGARADKAGERLTVGRLWNVFAKTFYDKSKGAERVITDKTRDHYMSSHDAFLQAGLSGIDGIEGAVIRVFDAPKLGNVGDRAKIIRGIVDKKKLPTDAEWKTLLKGKKKAKAGSGTTLKGACGALYRTTVNWSVAWGESDEMTPEMTVIFARIMADAKRLADLGAKIEQAPEEGAAKPAKKTFADRAREQEEKIAALQAKAAKELQKSGHKTLQ